MMDWKGALLGALQNKFIAVTLLALIWATFIHDLGLLYVARETTKLSQLKQELVDIQDRNEMFKQRQATLLSDPQALERFARERFFMRKPNEEVYRIVE